MDLSALNWASCAAAAVAIFLSIFYFYAKKKLSYWSRRGVNSPPAHILFGNMKDLVLLRRNSWDVLQDIYNSVDQDEPIVGCYLFHKPLLIIRSLDLVKQMMIRDFDVFPNRCFGGVLETDPVGYVNLLATRDSRWKYIRAKMTPSLTGQKLRNMFPLVLECSTKLMEYMESVKPDSENLKSFNLKETVGKYCNDVFASTAFGITINSFDKNNTEVWDAAQKVLSGWKSRVILLTNIFIPELIWLTALVSRGAKKIFRELFWYSYNTRVRVGNKRGDLIDSLMMLKNGEQNPDFVFDGDNLVGQSVSFFVAGLEATSTTISFTLYDLARNPEHEARAYEEIMKIVGTGELTMDKLTELTFLEKCIYESLRLHPALPLIDRICIQDYKIPGTDIILEKGTSIYVPSLGPNMDPRFFKNPDKYNPLRTNSEEFQLSTANVSFGIGPKTCIGQRLAIVISKIALAKILRKYRLIYNASADSELKPKTVFETVIHGTPLRIQERV